MLRKETCKYYNGIQNAKCEKGINYEKFVITRECMFEKIPCIRFNGNKDECEFYEEPTEQEIVEDEKRSEQTTEELLSVLPIIAKVKKEHANEDWKGKEKCPLCGNNLYLSHSAYNGHVWGKCQTDGCLDWME